MTVALRAGSMHMSRKGLAVDGDLKAGFSQILEQRFGCALT
jgi:hypothetical protein